MHLAVTIAAVSYLAVAQAQYVPSFASTSKILHMVRQIMD
jgi:hypothetical protein